jgi:hypothetical protein
MFCTDMSAWGTSAARLFNVAIALSKAGRRVKKMLQQFARKTTLITR